MTALPFWAPLALLGFAPWDDPRPAGGFAHLPILDPYRAGQEAAGAVRVDQEHPQLPADMARDVRSATSWRERFGYVFRGPGWSPDGSGGGTRG